MSENRAVHPVATMCRVLGVSPSGYHAWTRRTDYQGGDVGYVPKSMPHYIENTGATKFRYLELWQSDHFADISLAQWLAFIPWELMKAHLNIDKSVLSKISTKKTPVVGL